MKVSVRLRRHGRCLDTLNWTATAPPLFDYTQYPKIGRRAYTGHEQLDNLNLVHMGGRVYAPAIGRFMSPDPFIADAFDSQSLNRYSYARNNPLSRVNKWEAGPTPLARTITRRCSTPAPPTSP